VTQQVHTLVYQIDHFDPSLNLGYLDIRQPGETAQSPMGLDAHNQPDDLITLLPDQYPERHLNPIHADLHLGHGNGLHYHHIHAGTQVATLVPHA
jgi:hypothetical protein